MMAEIKSEDTHVVSKIIQYETGNMDEAETIEFFQELIDSGMAWTLQGSYGRMARTLIEVGQCTARAGLHGCTLANGD